MKPLGAIPIFASFALFAVLFSVSSAFAGAGDAVGKCSHPCPDGTECVAVEVHCIRAPCPPVSECRPIRKTAKTNAELCAEAKCREGTTCRIESAQCKRAPCPAFARCLEK